MTAIGNDIGYKYLFSRQIEAQGSKGDVFIGISTSGNSENIVEALKVCREKGKRFIDLGADFRLEEEEDYAQWYNGSFDDADLHKEAVYAIPELFREKIRGASLIANPGCYPTASALGLFPALKAGFISPSGIVIDAKSGVTGAGRSLTENTHFPVCNEAFSPYKIALHRHTPEIEQTLGKATGEKVTLLFVPHLLPLNRGIIATSYAKLAGDATLNDIHAYYSEFYQDEQFVRVLPLGAVANLRDVKYSNYCDISLHIDKRTGTLIVVSTIDNMVKGAAGQAVQNMNLMLGIPEDTGLRLVPPAF